MLSVQENEKLTRIEAGTPMGQLLRRYWHPVAPSVELWERPTKEVTILGEVLVLFRSRGGKLGLVASRCPHRRTSMVYGIPEDDGLRCPYHGWKYDFEGQCIEQPFDEIVNPDSRFKDKITMVSYPVQELGGLVWAYMGPDPAPLLPRWELLVADNVVRDICIADIPSNWLQIQENSVDPLHAEWLHEYFNSYVLEQESGVPWYAVEPIHKHKAVKIAFDPYEYGIIKRKVEEGGSEKDDSWAVGHPLIFPNMLYTGNALEVALQWRVPIDDTHTRHFTLYVYTPAPGSRAPEQPDIAYRYVPVKDEDDAYIVNRILNQDFMVWASQGDIARRELEHLGASDTGVILLRNMLSDAIKTVEDGGDPINVFRNPAENESIVLATEPTGSIDVVKLVSNLKYVPLQAGTSRDHDLIERTVETWGQARAQKAPAPV